MKSQITTKQNQIRVRGKVLSGLISIIAMIAVSGCQEAATVTNGQMSYLQNRPVMSDKIVTLTVFPEEKSVTLTEQKDIYLVGTQSYAQKLMSMYEDSDIPTLPTYTSQRGNQGTKCVPILMITY